jgi:flagellar hook-basal body complex protein FliE
MDPLQAKLSIGGLAPTSTASSAKPGQDGDFLAALKGALNALDASQNRAGELSKRFQLNDPGVSLEETMVATQQANIAFQAAVQVRNRLIAAYHDIMNMQI